MDSAAQRTGSREGRLEAVDALRGLAALAVVVTHIPRVDIRPGHWNGLFFLPADYGIKGVILFLVISGFCIHLGTARRAAHGDGLSCRWTTFWRRRFVRLYPPYLAAIGLSLLAKSCLWWRSMTFAEYQGYLVHTLPADLLTHLLMIHQLFPAYVAGLGNPVFWTLGLEEQLYVLYAAYLFLRSRLPVARAAIVTAVVTLVWYLGVGVIPWVTGRPFLEIWESWPFGFWFIWVLGAVAAEANAGVITLPQWCYARTVALAGAGLGVVLYPPLLEFLRVPELLTAWQGPQGLGPTILRSFWSVNRLGDYAFAVAFFVLLHRWVAAEMGGVPAGKVKRWLAWVGVRSYSLYLVHVPVLNAAEAVFEGCGIHYNLVGIPLRYLVEVPLCLAAAVGFFKVVESRFLNAASDADRKRQTTEGTEKRQSRTAA